MPTIVAPVTKATAAAITTSDMKRPSAACISLTRAGGSSTAAAGRRQKRVNAMPPTQATTASR